MMEARPILVCGGAGYIGSHMCKLLAARGVLPVTFDNLSTGHASAVRWGPLVTGDLLDTTSLRETLCNWDIQAVLHFAARSLVAESIRHPDLYFQNNAQGTASLLEAMSMEGTNRLVFSSSAAVYGQPEYLPIDESHPTKPINPYGESKLRAEMLIREACQQWGLHATSLRYFNAAGADSDGELGEDHSPETHLIPSAILAAIQTPPARVSIFGNDYATHDGTCVRDYVHVEDLCEAHLAAVESTRHEPGFRVYNLGSGRGHSVLEVVETCQRRLGGIPDADIMPRREGDPAVLVASIARAQVELGWRPRKSLDDCVRSAINWHCSPPPFEGLAR